MTPDELRDHIDQVKKKQLAQSHHVCVCMAAGCQSAGSEQVKEAMDRSVGDSKDIRVKNIGCMGLCSAGPMVSVPNDTIMYRDVKPQDTDRIVQSLGKEPQADLLCDLDAPFFKAQKKVVLENSGLIDPEDIDDCLLHGSYESFVEVLTDWDPLDVIDTIRKSGLRGRGGGGYPTGLKWSSVAKAVGDVKYVICNADEGDPGAFMDRCIIGSDPHRVIEGMAIAAYAIGASKGYVYIRAEYPLEIKRLKKAIAQARRYNLLGDNILGTSFSFSIEIRLGAGAFVCGEETALIESIHGKRGNPRPRPPYPAESGVKNKPSLINNVETLANIAPIIGNGPEWFASMGTENSKGTKVFALAGQIANTGLIEVPMGISMREIIYEIGGGVPGGKKVKAVQTGGPSGGCIPASMLDIPVDFESLKTLGSMMGSGGMIVIDETANMLDIAKFFMEFCQTESCGKCIPCRVGTTHMLEILDRFTKGLGTRREFEILKELCESTRATSLCGLGMSAPNPILSTMNYFEEEYTKAMQPELAEAATGGPE